MIVETVLQEGECANHRWYDEQRDERYKQVEMHIYAVFICVIRTRNTTKEYTNKNWKNRDMSLKNNGIRIYWNLNNNEIEIF